MRYEQRRKGCSSVAVHRSRSFCDQNAPNSFDGGLNGHDDRGAWDDNVQVSRALLPVQPAERLVRLFPAGALSVGNLTRPCRAR